MANSIDDGSIKSLNAVDQDVPSKTQWLPVKGRTISPLLKRVIVYNREDKSLLVRAKYPLNLSNPKACQKIPLPRRQSIVTIFVDPETKLDPTTSDVDAEGYSNLFVVKLHLDRLSTLNRILWFFGFIQNIYVMNPLPHWSESSSLQIDVPRVADVTALEHSKS